MNNRTRLLIVGAGGYGRSVAEAAAASGTYTLVGFVDDRWPELATVLGHPVLGKLSQLAALRSQADAVIVAIGDNEHRRNAFLHAQESGFELARIVHPSATVSPSAVLGHGVTVMAGATVGCEARLAEGVIVNTGAIVDHHAEVGVFAHLEAGACMPGGSALGAGSRLASRVALRPGQRVGPGVLVGHDTHQEI